MDSLASIEESQLGYKGTIDVTFDGNIAIICMKCGENRLNWTFVKKMSKALDDVESNKEAQVLVTIGEGKFFSNGLDLDWQGKLQRADETLFQQFRIEWSTLLYRILTFPLPTIAAINGHAFAGGAILALYYDYRVMQEDRGWWCVNEVHLGMSLQGHLAQLFRQKLPNQTVHEATVLGRRYTAQEALWAGILKKTCSDKDLLKTAVDMGRELIKENKPYGRAFLHKMKAVIFPNYRSDL